MLAATLVHKHDDEHRHLLWMQSWIPLAGLLWVLLASPVNIPLQTKVNDASTGGEILSVPTLDSLGTRAFSPLILCLSTSLTGLSVVPFLSQNTSECPTLVWLWERERGAEGFGLKNKLIHAEVNCQVQLNKQKSPSGSVNFNVFTGGFSTAETFTNNWELLEEVYIFTAQELQF